MHSRRDSNDLHGALTARREFRAGITQLVQLSDSRI